jgi:hypothetical protein
VDGNGEVVVSSSLLQSSSALVQVAQVQERLVAVGFEADSVSEPATAVALALDPETLEVQGRLELRGREDGRSAVFESLVLSSSGKLLLGGSWGGTRSGIEGLKSYGNIYGGRGVLVEVDPEVWFAAGRETLSLDGNEALVLEVPEVHSIKSLAVAANGTVAGVGHDDSERSGVVWFESDLLRHRWTHFEDGFELTAVEVVSTVNEGVAAVVVGHGGEGTIDGHIKKVDQDGVVIWSTTFGNPSLAASEVAEDGLASDVFVYDECWGLVAFEDGVAVACGTGIENCHEVDSTAADQKACRSDPRRSWRSYLVGVSASGEVVWSRAESFVDDLGEAHESASEYIAIGPSGHLYSVVDQGFGVGLARFGR